MKDCYVLHYKNKVFANHLGSLQIYTADMLSMPLTSNGIDLILTSPPYSYIIDYPSYNTNQLKFLQYNTTIIRQNSYLNVSTRSKQPFSEHILIFKII